MNCKMNFDLNWLFKPSFDLKDITQPNTDGFVPVHLPHTVKELAYNCFSHSETAMFATYVKHFCVPPQHANQRVILEFDGVMAYHELYVNGQKAGTHIGGYSRSRFDITPYLAAQNTILVMVDSHENKEIPPFGYTIDYLTYGGIYRSVSLYFAEDIYFDNVLFRYDLQGQNATLYPELYVQNNGQKTSVCVQISLADAQGTCVKSYQRTVTLACGSSHVVLEKESISDIALWDLDTPNLYTATLTLMQEETPLDVYTVKVGFRTVECKPNGFFLNGKKIKLVGLDRHQAYPYVGYAMPPRVQRKDVDIFKNYLHVNTVRTSHYMQSEEFLAACDEMGLLVFAETPGWGYIGDETFKENSLHDIEAMITTEYNHPSIFIWSIRINESNDDDAFYTRTNALAKSLDTSRATTGVRCIKKSNLIEDVYTYNDFIHFSHPVKNYREIALVNQQTVTGLTHQVPFMVSEYCGHVFPVKSFDGEEKKMRHVLMHAAVQSANQYRTDAMGAIGWCAFDYNTHGDYGSGDKICYHGVMDMFRIPKYAAEVYRSQVDPKIEVVLEPATVFARGENDDNRPIPFVVLTNCDYIEVVAYDKVIGKYFPSLTYGGLAHPPIMVEEDPGRWQDIWNGGAIIGYCNGVEVARKTYARDAYLSALQVCADDCALQNTVVDATRFVCRYLDQNENILPFYNGIIQVETSGDIALIGPSLLTTLGGATAFWVKTLPTGKQGTATVTIKAVNTQLPSQTFTIHLAPQDTITVI